MKKLNYLINQTAVYIPQMILFVFMLISCSVMGQLKAKKQLTPADYSKWGTLFVEEISEKGNWVSYSMRNFELQIDTLFVKNTKSKQTVVIPNGTKGKFNQEEQFACLTPEGVLEVNLKTTKKQLFKNTTAYTFSTNGKYFIVEKEDTNNHKSLEIKSSNGKTVKTIESINSYNLNKHSDKLICITKSTTNNAMLIIDLEKSLSETIIIESSIYNFSNPTWNSQGNALVFFEDSLDNKAEKNKKIGYYNCKENKLLQFSMEDNSNMAETMQIDSNPQIPLTISDDGQRVFFRISEKQNLNNKKSPETVQIWRASDNWIYPVIKKFDNWKKTPKTALWNIATNQFLAITDTQYPKLILDGKQEWALIYNPMANKSSYKRDDDRDYYSKNLRTGETQLAIKQLPASLSETLMIPNTHYLVYYQNKNYWLLDLSTQRIQNLTENLNINIENSNYDRPGDIPSYGIAAWNKTNNSILIYDQYDIWEIAIDTKKATRLTSGKENEICFRIAKLKNGSWETSNYDGLSCREVDLDEGLILEATNANTITSGYYSWDRTDKESKIIFTDKRIDQLFKATKNNNYVYRQQDYDSPPSLLFKDKSVKSPQKLFQSNLQHYNYYWGKSELIHYQNPQGKPLKGILYYPANYDPSIKYPMIVDIYEKQSKELHYYVNPTDLAGGEACRTNFISQGYFYLMPDIVYEIGKPAISALECVTAATQSIIDKGLVNPKKIGLTGHSYGGYESCFIATQTNLFATVVIGAPATNLNSYYLTVNWDVGRPQMWRIENQQWRMGKSLFDDWEAYNQNSPIYYTKNVSVPLLIWTGEKDNNVNTSQTIELYLALKRLDKKAIMLYYPNEGHALMKEKTQRDFSHRIHNWFDYYLKDQTRESWIVDTKN